MQNAKRISLVSLFIMGLSLWSECALAKRDFKGLFGTYRREKFTENEGNESDWGVDFMLSTLYPVSSVAKTYTTGAPSNSTAIPSTISFNLEANIYRTFGYSNLVYLNVGTISYDARKQNETPNNNPSNSTGNVTNLTQFTTFSMSSYPFLLGYKYRMSETDFVPYLGVAGGISLVQRNVTYNFSTLTHSSSTMAPTFQGYGGFEFFFAPNAGLRLEIGVQAMLLKEELKDTNAPSVPSVIFPSNPFAVRYASGVFVLF